MRAAAAAAGPIFASPLPLVVLTGKGKKGRRKERGKDKEDREAGLVRWCTSTRSEPKIDLCEELRVSVSFLLAKTLRERVGKKRKKNIEKRIVEYDNPSTERPSRTCLLDVYRTIHLSMGPGCTVRTQRMLQKGEQCMHDKHTCSSYGFCLCVYLYLYPCPCRDHGHGLVLCHGHGRHLDPCSSGKEEIEEREKEKI